MLTHGRRCGCAVDKRVVALTSTQQLLVPNVAYLYFSFCLPFLFVFFLLPFLCVLPSPLFLLLSLTFQNIDPLRFQAGGRRR